MKNKLLVVTIFLLPFIVSCTGILNKSDREFKCNAIFELGKKYIKYIYIDKETKQEFHLFCQDEQGNYEPIIMTLGEEDYIFGYINIDKIDKDLEEYDKVKKKDFGI